MQNHSPCNLEAILVLFSCYISSKLIFFLLRRMKGRFRRYRNKYRRQDLKTKWQSMISSSNLNLKAIVDYLYFPFHSYFLSLILCLYICDLFVVVSFIAITLFIFGWTIIAATVQLEPKASFCYYFCGDFVIAVPFLCSSYLFKVWWIDAVISLCNIVFIGYMKLYKTDINDILITLYIYYFTLQAFINFTNIMEYAQLCYFTTKFLLMNECWIFFNNTKNYLIMLIQLKVIKM